MENVSTTLRSKSEHERLLPRALHFRGLSSDLFLAHLESEGPRRHALPDKYPRDQAPEFLAQMALTHSQG